MIEILNAACGSTQGPTFGAAGIFTQIEPIMCTPRKTDTTALSVIYPHMRVSALCNCSQMVEVSWQSEWICVCVCVSVARVSSCPRKAWEVASQQKCLKAKFPEPPDPLYEVRGIDIFCHFIDNFIERSVLSLSTCFINLNQQFKNQQKSSTQTKPDCSVTV